MVAIYLEWFMWRVGEGRGGHGGPPGESATLAGAGGGGGAGVTAWGRRKGVKLLQGENMGVGLRGSPMQLKCPTTGCLQRGWGVKVAA